MFDLEEDFKEFPIIVATGLLGYLRFSQYNPTDAPYVPPTKEQVVWEYQNVPLFNRTVDTIVSHLRHCLTTSDSNSEGEGRCIECGEVDGKHLFGCKMPKID